MAEPPAATGGTFTASAILLIAAICQIFPGTYLPMFDTHQIRAASPNEIRACHSATIRRQTSTSSAYVANTTTPDSSM